MADPSVLNKRYLIGVMSIVSSLQTLGVQVDLPNHRDPFIRQVLTIETIAKAVESLVKPADAPAITVSEEMTVADLKEFARANGINLDNAKTKADIIHTINASLPE